MTIASLSLVREPSAAPALVALLVAAIVGALGSRSPRSPARPAGEPAVESTAQRSLVLVARLVETWRLRRRSKRTVPPAAIAQWCDELARTLRHGSTLRVAVMSTSSPDALLTRHIDAIRHQLDRGATVPDACDHWTRRLETDPASAQRSASLRTTSAVLAATAALGGDSAEPLDRLAAAMRQRTSDELARASHSAQATMSANVLTLVPLAVLGLLVLTDDDVRAALTTPAGSAAVTFGIALNATGAIWMRRIVRRGAST